MKSSQAISISAFLTIVLIALSGVLAGCELNIPGRATETLIAIPTIITTQLPQATSPVSAPTSQGNIIETLTANLSDIIGEVYALQPNQPNFEKAKDYMVINSGGQIRTLENSKVRLDISDGNIVRLGPSTIFTLQGEESTAEGLFTRLKIEAGELWIILKGGSLNVETPSGVASVRGSYMSVSVDPQSGTVKITCLEGTCSIKNDGGTVTLVAGETAQVVNSTTPPTTGRMSEADVKKWLEMNPEATVIVLAHSATVDTLPTETSTSELPGGTIPQETSTPIQ